MHTPLNKPPRKSTKLPLASLAPNIITLLGLFIGMLSIHFSIKEQYFIACNLIFGAAFLDSIDGRVARFLKSSSYFGEALDSLVDVINFGVAPAFLIFLCFLDNTSYGWLAVYIYTSCAAMRLARFNTELKKDNQPKWIHNYFIGVPVPAGALLLMLPLYINFANGDYYGNILHNWNDTLLITIYFLFVGALMVLPLRTFSGKMYEFSISPSMRKAILLAALLFITVIYLFYWNAIIGLSIMYLLHIPIAHLRYQKNLKSFTHDQNM